jgi:hypothetical protein
LIINCLYVSDGGLAVGTVFLLGKFILKVLGKSLGISFVHMQNCELKIYENVPEFVSILFTHPVFSRIRIMCPIGATCL